MREFLKVQLSEMASLTDTDRKKPSQYFLSYIPVYVFIFFFFTLIMLDWEMKKKFVLSLLSYKGTWS